MTSPSAQTQHALSGTAKFSFGLSKVLFRALEVSEIGSNSPAGERSRAGIIDLVTQPATVPPRSTQGEAVPPQGIEP